MKYKGKTMKSFKQMLKEDNKNFLYYYNQIDFIRAELYQCEKLLTRRTVFCSTKGV